MLEPARTITSLRAVFWLHWVRHVATFSGADVRREAWEVVAKKRGIRYANWKPFHGVLSGQRLISRGTHARRDFDLVEVVDALPGFAGSALVYDHPIWDFMLTAPTTLAEAQAAHFLSFANRRLRQEVGPPLRVKRKTASDAELASLTFDLESGFPAAVERPPQLFALDCLHFALTSRRLAASVAMEHSRQHFEAWAAQSFAALSACSWWPDKDLLRLEGVLRMFALNERVSIAIGSPTRMTFRHLMVWIAHLSLHKQLVRAGAVAHQMERHALREVLDRIVVARTSIFPLHDLIPVSDVAIEKVI